MTPRAGGSPPHPSPAALWGWASPTHSTARTQPPIWLGRESTSLLHQDICTELEGKSCLSN